MLGKSEILVPPNRRFKRDSPRRGGTKRAEDECRAVSYCPIVLEVWVSIFSRASMMCTRSAQPPHCVGPMVQLPPSGRDNEGSIAMGTFSSDFFSVKLLISGVVG